MRHRAEIDGLRAIAVLPVIFFHAGFNAFHGGFIGVDVFFVISGYLITSLIDEDRQRARFSIAEFYERRARRILPALFFVLTCCLLAAWWVMNSSDFISFGRSLAAVSVFSSGLLYIFTAGYFDPSSDLNPLLHTWSLGVEEQYYMLFPPIFMLLARLGSMKLRIGLLVLTIASLAYAQWGHHHLPDCHLLLHADAGLGAVDRCPAGLESGTAEPVSTMAEPGHVCAGHGPSADCCGSL